MIPWTATETSFPCVSVPESWRTSRGSVTVLLESSRRNLWRPGAERQVSLCSDKLPANIQRSQVNFWSASLEFDIPSLWSHTTKCNHPCVWKCICFWPEERSSNTNNEVHMCRLIDCTDQQEVDLEISEQTDCLECYVHQWRAEGCRCIWSIIITYCDICIQSFTGAVCRPHREQQC